MQIAPGTKLGPYEILSQIGAGGMGVVWQARDTRLDRIVAIKSLPSEFGTSAQFRLRFEREAKVISSLNHPHICTLFDVGDEYLVMELLEGESLADRLAKGPLPMAQVLRFGSQIAQALDAAHRQGVIHRDLKPANVILTRGGAKLLDFGLAKNGIFGDSFSGGSELGATQQKPLTEEGTILGTFQYMAPEQLEGLEADARTDIFALGALLYEMATGRRAFQGSSRTSLIAAIVSAEPAAVSSMVPLAPPALDHLIGRCLQKDPEDRWHSAHDIASELAWIAEAGSQAGVATPITIRRKARERLAWAVATALLITSVVLTALLWRASEPAAPIRTAILPPDGILLPLTDDAPAGAVPAPDGTKLVYRGVGTGQVASLFLHDLATGEITPLPGTRDAQYPYWSPDSRWIGFFSQAASAMMKIDTTGGPPTRITEALNGKGGTWSAAGEILFAPDYGSPLSIVPASGGDAREVTRLDLSRHNSHRHPRFLPGGKKFLFLARSIQEGRESSIFLGSLDGSEPREIMQSSTQVEYAAGHLVFERGETLMVQRFDPDSGILEGDPIPIGGLGVEARRGASFAALGVAGERLLVYQTRSGGSERALELRDVESAELLRTLVGEANYEAVSLSPSGRWIAATIQSAGGEVDVWVMESAGGAPRRFQSIGEDRSPIWSADERSILFASNVKGRFGIYRRILDSAAPPEIVMESSDDLFPLASVPEGGPTLIVRVKPDAPVSERYSVEILDEESGSATVLLPGAFVASVSGDGKRIAWGVFGSEGFDLFTASYPALTERRPLAKGVSRFFWSGNSGEIFYEDVKDTLFALDLDGPVATPREIPFPGTVLGLSRDGRSFFTLADPAEPLSSTIHVIQNWTPKR